MLLQVGRAVPTTPWELVLTSSRETKFVLAILVAFSLVSWYLIFLKWWQFRRTRRQADRFMAQIEKAARLEDAYHAAMRLPSSPYNRLLREGIHFFSELKPGGLKDHGRGDGPAVETQATLTTTQLEALRMATERMETIESGATIVSGMEAENIVEAVTLAVSLPWSARYEFEEDYSPSSVVVNAIRTKITNFF